ncbi:MAG: hypothetical protein WA823_12015 [Candidatus Acidiferrales bacterium]
MFSIIALVVGGLFVAGFYGYVFVHLYSEFLKQRVRHSRSDSHVSTIKVGATTKQSEHNSKPPSHQIRFGNDKLLNIAIACFGLISLFGELFVLNGLVASSHSVCLRAGSTISN